jgi:hypothetical protein
VVTQWLHDLKYARYGHALNSAAAPHTYLAESVYKVVLQKSNFRTNPSTKPLLLQKYKNGEFVTIDCTTTS